MQLLKVNFKLFIYSFILLSIFLIVIYPFLHDGFFPTFDDVQVVRIDEMHKELRSGQFPVRYVNNLGNGGGYFLYNFYSPLTYYFGAIFHLGGFSLVQSTKIIFISSYLVGITGSLLLLRRYTNTFLAILGSLLLITSSYVGYDAFTRGALPELFALMIIPLLFWSLFKIIDTKKLLFCCIAGVLYASIILAHHISAFIMSIFIFLFLIIFYDRKSMFYVLLSLVIGLLLSAFYWVPVLFENKLINLTSNSSIIGQYSSNFLNPFELGGISNINWGFNPPMLGANLFIGSLFSLIYFMLNKKSKLVYFLAISVIFCYFIISPYSKIIWDNVSIFKLIQFPWRFLTILTFFSIFITIYFIYLIKNRHIAYGFILLIIALSLLNIDYLKPSTYNYIDKYKAEDTCSSTTWGQEYLPIDAKKCIPKKTLVPLIQSPNVLVSQVHESDNGRKIEFNALGEGDILVKRYYYPSWVAEIDGEKVRISPKGDYGLINISIPKGHHKINLKLENTLYQNLGNYISLMGLFILISLPIFKKYFNLK